MITVEANEEDVPVEEEVDTARLLDQIPEEDMGYDPYQAELSLPEIKASVLDDRDRKKFPNRRAISHKKKDDENLFIYKDFDTSLTAVKGNIKKLPVLEQTTA